MRIFGVLSILILLSLLLSIFSLPIFGYCQTYECLVAAVKNFSPPANASPIALANFYLDAILYSGLAVFSGDRLLPSLLCLIVLAFALLLKTAADLILNSPGSFFEEKVFPVKETFFSWLALHETSPTLS